MHVITRTSIAAGLTGAFCIDAFLLLVVALVYRSDPMQLMLWDASTVLGAAAFTGGWTAAVIGTVMHVAVSLVWAGIFVAACVRFPALLTRPVVTGIVFGVIAMLVMRYAIVPLSHAASLHAWTLRGLIVQATAHTLFFGIPVAWVTRRSLRAAERAQCGGVVMGARA